MDSEDSLESSTMFERRRSTVRRSCLSLAVGALLFGGIAFSSGTPAYATTPPTLSIFAGTPGTSGTPQGGPATSSPLYRPTGLGIASDGSVYIGNVPSRGVDKVTSGMLSVLSTSSLEPEQLAITSSGTVLVADDGLVGLQEINSTGGLTTVPGTSSVQSPDGVAVDSSGDVYFSAGDYAPYDIYKISPSGTVSVFATQAQIGSAWNLAVDSAGNVYATDIYGGVVHRITPAGVVTTVAGDVSGSTPATNFTLASPTGVAVDAAGDVFISDTGAYKVVEVTPSGSISTVAGTGSSGQPVAGTASLSPLAGPHGLAIDPAGDLFIADTNQGTQSLVEEVVGLSPPSTPVPGTPTEGGGSIVFPWTAVPGVTSYTVTVYVNGVAQAPITGLTGLSYTLANPLAGASYSFTVAAVAGGGTGSFSQQSASVTTPTAAPSPSGYWSVGSDGGVFSFGPAFYGSTGNLTLNQPVVAMTSTSDGKGYWFVAKDGGVFSYGDAGFHGSVPGVGVHVTNIVGMAADTATGGYWMVGSDGGVYAFGAPYDGSVPGLGQHLTTIVGIAATPDGGGYYLVSSTGAVYAFGDAKYQGGANTLAHINAPIVGLSVDSVTGGYWEAGSDGGIYAYGAPFEGSAGATKLNKPVVGIAASGSGYYLVASDGGVFSYNAPFLGSMGGKSLNAPMVGIAVAG